MRTVRRFEASDINLNDPVPAYLAATITYTMMAVISAPAPTSIEQTDTFLREVVSSLLNMAEDTGISIAKREPGSADVFDTKFWGGALHD